MSKLDLDQQRKRAKDLKRAHRRGDLAAAERVGRHLRRPPEHELKLGEAQLVVAREAGFASWPAMRRAIGRDVLELALRGEPVDPAAITRSIHVAAACADVAAVLALLDADPALADQRDPTREWTPLLCACCGRGGTAAARIAIARRLLELGADVDALGREPGLTSAHVTALDEHEWRPLEGAAGRVASAELVQLLLDRGADLGKTGAFVTRCVQSGDLDVLRVGLAARPPWWQTIWALVACVELDRADPVPALVAAAERPSVLRNALLAAVRLHRDWVELLLGDAPAPAWRDAYRAATRYGHTHAVAALRRRGLDDSLLDATDRAIAACVAGARAAAPGVLTDDDHRMLSWAIHTERFDAVPRLLAIGLDPNVADLDGLTPLHLAARLGAEDLLDALLAAGARRGARDYDGRTPYDVALEHGRDIPRLQAGVVDVDIPDALFERAADAVAFGDLDTLRALLDAEPTLVEARSPRPHRATLLNYCGANGTEHPRQRTPANAPAVAELLLARGADPDAACKLYGAATTLDLVLTSAFPRDAKLDGELVRVLARAGARLTRGDLATAILHGSALAVAALVEHGVPLDDLFGAAGSGDVGRLRELLEAGADVDARFQGGCTALHAAAAMGEHAAAELLIARGADRELRDDTWDGTPAGWAEHFGHADLAAALRTPR